MLATPSLSVLLLAASSSASAAGGLAPSSRNCLLRSSFSLRRLSALRSAEPLSRGEDGREAAGELAAEVAAEVAAEAAEVAAEVWRDEDGDVISEK